MTADPAPLDVTWSGLALAAMLLLVAAGLSRWQRVGLESRYLIGGLRAFLQLFAVGYVLVYVFGAARWWLVLLALAIMLAVATVAATRGRGVGSRSRRLWRINGSGMLVSSGLTLAYVSGVVLHVSPWYEPRYLIPMFGMIIGNAMNGAALSAERLETEMLRERATIEAYLALGATPGRAAAEPVRRALTAASIPAINGLMVVGLVQLPGMMTGQILAGASPLLAVRYQIVVAVMLTFATTLTSVLVVLGYRRPFFTAACQLVIPPAEARSGRSRSPP